jgi:hypothetical protein
LSNKLLNIDFYIILFFNLKRRFGYVPNQEQKAEYFPAY